MSKRLTRYAATLLISTLLLSACSGSKTENPSNITSPSGPVKLVIGAPADIQHWDIHNHNYTYTEAVHQHVFDYLVYMNAQTGKVEPGLAESYKAVDPVTWEFKLRKDVKFQNGDEFTAEDVKFTLERVSRDKSLKEYPSNRTIKEVKVVDPLTVQIITDGPDPVLLNRLSRIGSGMLPGKYFKEKGVDGFNKAPIGTGGYKVAEWIKDDHLTLKAWAEGWRGKPKIDEIVYRVIPEVQTRVNELKTGGIDIALNISPDDVKALKSDPDVQVYNEATPRVYVARFRVTGNYITADKRVREAIDLAIDDKALGEAAFPGLTIPTRTRLIPGVTGFHKELYDTFLYDPAKAKKLLEEAGFTGGKQPEIGFLARNSGDDSPVAQTITGMLEKVGFKVKLELLDPVAYTKKINANQNPDMYLTAFGNSMKDGDLALNFIKTATNKDYMGYSVKRLDDLLDAEAKEMDAAKRDQMLFDIDNTMTEDRPQLAFFRVKSAVAVHKGVNWKPSPDEMHWFYNATKGK
jgi:peptide/nickel transport system substrate-binding protein